MTYRRYLLLGLIVLLSALLTGCVRSTPDTAQLTPQPQSVISVAKAQERSVNAMPLVDKKALYEEYNPVSLVHYYITVRKGNAVDGTNHTLEEVNSYLNLQGMTGVEKIKTEVIFQVGDERGPLPGEVGFGATQPNATMNVRGRTSTGYPQKSYRIDLFDSAGLWRGQRAIAINKHPNDPTRIRNAVYFRLLQEVPDLTSLRTQFVRVYIKDETKAERDFVFEDYGLFTQVELPNGRYLRNHELSRGGNLYKANLSELYRYPEAIKLVTDPDYDATAFSAVMEPKTGDDHSKLIAMLEAVNNYGMPIEDVIEKHFDVENITSYLAFNLLMANPDSNAQNYLLYSPVNSSTWYYLLWDGDGSLYFYEDELLQNAWTETDWSKGISNFWTVVLFNRMLRVPEYRQQLVAKVELLRHIITPAKIARIIADYRQVVDPFIRRLPDTVHMGVPLEQLELIYQNMPQDTQTAYENFVASLEKPMPYYMGDVQQDDGMLYFNWDAAYDFDGEFVYYDMQISSDWTFSPQALVFEDEPRKLGLESVVPMLPPGTYFWRASATNQSGQTQIAFDEVALSGIYGGMRRFEITAQGEVINYH